MSEEESLPCLCPLRGVIDVIGKKWSLLVINSIGNHGRLRFNKLMDELQGISPKTLSETLKELQKEKLVLRESFAEIPPRVVYSLTKDGADLRRAVVPLLRWAAERTHNDDSNCVPSYCRMSAHRMSNMAEETGKK